MANSYSLVSVVIPALNEEKFIRNCLMSLLESTFPQEKLEILVVDGGSTDGTVAEVEAMARDFPQIRLFHNQRKIVSCAMNLGAMEAGGEILVRVDAHAIYDPNYLSLSVATLLKTGAGGVGGLVTTRGNNFLGRVVATAISTSVGSGGAQWRSGTTPGWVETIWCGCFWKDDFLKIGGFDEDWKFNQDAEFNMRIKQLIGGLYFHPEIKATYFSRSSLSSLVSQYFRYGWWRAKTFLRHPSTFRARQAIPLLFFLALLLTASVYQENPVYLKLLLASYLVVILAAIALKKSFNLNAPFVPFVLFVMHVTWATGFLLGLTVSPFSNSRRNPMEYQ